MAACMHAGEHCIERWKAVRQRRRGGRERRRDGERA